MFDVLMYLFETYIHTEAELRVDQDLSRIRDRAGKACGLSGRTGRTDATGL